MTDKFKNLTEKLKKLCDSIRNKPVLLCGIGCFVLFCLAFFTIYFVRVVYEPKWIGQIGGTLVLFGILVVIFGGALLAKKFCRNNTALFMMVLIFITGVLFCFITPPNQVPDEQSHYLRSYAMGMGDFHFDEQQQWPNDVYLLMEAFPVAYRNGYPAEKGCSILDRFDMYFDDMASGKKGQPMGIIIFQIIPYLPQALGIFIGRLFGADALVCYYLARLVNLMFYTACCYFALRWASRWRMMLYALMIMPLTMFVVSSCNNDCMLFGLMFLVFSTVLSDSFDKKKAITFAVSFAVMCTSKMNYIVFILLLLLLPKKRWNVKIKRWQFVLAVLAAFLVVYQGMGYAVAWLSNYGPIERTMADSNPAQQLMFIIKNPLRYIVVFLDTMRNNSFFMFTGGLFGWIDVDIKIISNLTPIVLLAAAVKNAPLLKKEDFDRVVVFFVTAVLTYGVCATGMYLSWAPVTLPQIIGLQMRYFIPGFMGLLMAVSYWVKGYMKNDCETDKTDISLAGTMATGESSTIWIGFVFAVVAVALLFAAYYFPVKTIVFVS
ncbi:MAG: DUF2142 domain-containing protein [Ruminococcaceae bacterium]|nr:DUF2142 domain-containing protein [Oscillospiraceae bacterium]